MSLSNQGQLTGRIAAITRYEEENSHLNIFVIASRSYWSKEDQCRIEQEPIKVGFKLWRAQKKRMLVLLEKHVVAKGDEITIQYELSPYTSKNGNERIDFNCLDFALGRRSKENEGKATQSTPPKTQRTQPASSSYEDNGWDDFPVPTATKPTPKTAPAQPPSDWDNTPWDVEPNF